MASAPTATPIAPIPSEIITSDNQSPLVSLVTWVTMTIAILAAITKIATKWAIKRQEELDDAYMAAALLATIAVDVAISEAANFGLGKHTTTDGVDIENLQKSLYVGELFYVVSICLSKMPILQFLISLARRERRLRSVQVVMAANITIMVIGIFCVAFQCSLPKPWEVLIATQCIDRPAFWDFYGAMDILIDLAIVFLPIYLLHDLQMQRTKKISAMAAFSVRLITVPLVILRLVFLSLYTTSDQTFSLANTVIVTSAHANVSIIAACIPFFRPVMDAMQSGVMNPDVRMLNGNTIRSGGGMDGTKGKAYGLQHLDSSGRDMYGYSAKSSCVAGPKRNSTLKGAITSVGGGKGDTQGRDSSESRQKMIIRAETTIQVLEEHRDSF